MTGERKLQGQIVRAINKAPLDAWAVPNIVVRKSRKAFTEITGLGTGSPDIYVAIRYGAHLWLEVKCDETAPATPDPQSRPAVRRRGRLSDAQREWHEKALAFGIEVVEVRSVAEALAAVVKARAESQKRMKLLLQGVVAGVAVAAGKALLGRALAAAVSEQPSATPTHQADGRIGSAGAARKLPPTFAP